MSIFFELKMTVILAPNEIFFQAHYKPCRGIPSTDDFLFLCIILSSQTRKDQNCFSCDSWSYPTLNTKSQLQQQRQQQQQQFYTSTFMLHVRRKNIPGESIRTPGV